MRPTKLRILIVPDKFKATLTAEEASNAMARGWHKIRPGDELTKIPMSDGGDGFGEVIGTLVGAKRRSTRSCDASGKACSVPWWWIPATKTAIVESAQAIGLAMLPKGKFHPFELDTAGLGKLLKSIADASARRCLIGIGGSATNDGGFGMAKALGWKFLDANGRRIGRWTDLHTLTTLIAPAQPRYFQETVVAVDVKNPLLGIRGATRVYGPQKGLRSEDFAKAESNLRRLAKVVDSELGENLAQQPGAGAAGGLGFGLRAFLGARFENGFDVFARYSDLRRRIRCADLVVTGEGCLDDSTLMGKGVGRVAALCKQAGVPCMAMAGIVNTTRRHHRLFTDVRALTELTSEVQAKARPAHWLERLSAKTAQETIQGRVLT